MVARPFSCCIICALAGPFLGRAAADSTTQALTQTRTAVDELSRMAAELRAGVARFTY